MINFTNLDKSAYENLRYEILLKVERSEREPYPDSLGIPTIGIGFNLQDQYARNAVLEALGFEDVENPNSPHAVYIAQIEKFISDHLEKKITWTELVDGLNDVMVLKTGDQTAKFEFDNDTQIRNAFDTLMKEEYEGRVNNWLAGIPKSKERAVLISMAWNGWINTGRSPSLRRAVISGNRAEAWYEIRYNTNPIKDSDGNLITAATRTNWATRHYYESEVFGLYDAGVSGDTIDEATAKQTYAMYTKHREKILDYENTFGEGQTGTDNRRERANSIYEVGTLVRSIEQSFNTAFSYLKTNYIDTLENKVAIDFRDVQIGTDESDTLNGTVRDEYTLGEGDEHNDLIFGEGGNDTIDGMGGDDVLYGGDDSDIISGGEGNDVITGGKGYDILSGGSGNDTFLVTGEDEEYDVFNGGSGSDKILGGAEADTIRLHTFSSDIDGDFTVEEIDGGGGTNKIAGTKENDTIDLSNTEIKNIDSIELGGGDDTLTVQKDTLDSVPTIDGGDNTDTLIGSDEGEIFDLASGAIKNIEIIRAGGGDDIIQVDQLTEGSGIQEIDGGSGENILAGNDQDNLIDLQHATITNISKIDGGGGKDTIIGTGEQENLYGGMGDDTLTSNGGGDELYGGFGKDTYHAGNGDIINDADQSGKVIFEGSSLSYGKKEKGKDYYEGDGGEYRLNGSTLTFTKDGQTVTINNYSKGALGITLEDEEDPEPPENESIATQNFASPLVLDLNGNGQTSTSIFESDTHFDLDGDGFKEKTGWVEGEDGLLALDKNQNGVIDNGGELFGNNTLDKNGNPFKDGFEALSFYDHNKQKKCSSEPSVTLW